MTAKVKIPEKIEALSRAQTLRPGSYRLMDHPQAAVMIKAAEVKGRKPADWSEADWMLALLELTEEKAAAAYYQGIDEGYQTGQERGQNQARAAAESFRRSLEALEMSLLEFYSGVERWSVKLAMNIAEKVVGKAADQHEDLVKQTVRHAIAELADRSRILVSVHPSDFEALKGMRSEIMALSEGIEHFKIEADGAITPGSCRIETPSGLLDADFTTQLSELRRALIFQEEAAK